MLTGAILMPSLFHRATSTCALARRQWRRRWDTCILYRRHVATSTGAQQHRPQQHCRYDQQQTGNHDQPDHHEQLQQCTGYPHHCRVEFRHLGWTASSKPNVGAACCRCWSSTTDVQCIAARKCGATWQYGRIRIAAAKATAAAARGGSIVCIACRTT